MEFIKVSVTDSESIMTVQCKYCADYCNDKGSNREHNKENNAKHTGG